MTRAQANARHAAARRKAATLARYNRQLRQDVAALLALRIRTADNTPEMMATVARIARKHITHT